MLLFLCSAISFWAFLWWFVGGVDTVENYWDFCMQTLGGRETEVSDADCDLFFAFALGL